MPDHKITPMPGIIPDEQRVVEYCVGYAKTSIVYPGIMQCLSLTRVSHIGLIGTHISPGCTANDIKDTIKLLKLIGGQNHHWYVVGNFTIFAQHTKIGWGSIPLVVKALKKGGLDGQYKVFDTTTIMKTAGWTWGLDIKATRVPSVGVNTPPRVEFSCDKSGGNQKTKTFATTFQTHPIA